MIETRSAAYAASAGSSSARLAPRAEVLGRQRPWRPLPLLQPRSWVEALATTSR